MKKEKRVDREETLKLLAHSALALAEVASEAANNETGEARNALIALARAGLAKAKQYRDETGVL